MLGSDSEAMLLSAAIQSTMCHAMPCYSDLSCAASRRVHEQAEEAEAERLREAEKQAKKGNKAFASLTGGQAALGHAHHATGGHGAIVDRSASIYGVHDAVFGGSADVYGGGFAPGRGPVGHPHCTSWNRKTDSYCPKRAPKAVEVGCKELGSRM
eukprot:3656679-Rhodomonas_salina.3